MERLNPEMKKLLDSAIDRKASDLHLTVGLGPTLRVDGKLLPVEGGEVLTAEETEKCTELSAAIAEKNVKYPLSPREANLFIAETVLEP